MPPITFRNRRTLAMRSVRALALTLSVGGAALASASAQQPDVANAQSRTRSAQSGLEREFRSLVNEASSPRWVGYRVPMISGHHQICCGNFSDGDWNCCGTCRLEDRTSGMNVNTRDGRIELEGARQLLVLYRLDDRRVVRIRTFTPDCALDAGGLPFVWLTDVRPAESVTLLATYAASDTGGEDDDHGDERIGKAAISAIAFHGDASADQALERFVAAGQPESMRKHTAFWLGNARGRRGFEVLRKLLRDEASESFRKSAVFALSQSKEPEAVDTLIGLAREDRSEPVRSEALFWLAQRGDARAPQAIAAALEKDPSASVRKKAVFALSQLPKDQGVPLLIQAARTNQDASIRGEAIFWLGQRAGKKAADAITETIDRDPETEVKKKAVFALSQLPRDEGVPLLIQVARTNRNATVRKQAIFWLGQSRDPRALTFFEEVLKK